MEYNRIFKFEATTGSTLWRNFISFMDKPLSHLIGFETLNDIYNEAASRSSQYGFMQCVLDAMNVTFNISESDLERIPKTGPVIVVANHPYGGIEGVMMGALMARVRQDYRIMGNYFLHTIPHLREMIIAVDPFGGRDSSRSNANPLKQCMKALRQEQMLCIFPAGEVSHMYFKKRTVTDPAWSDTVARLARRTGAPVLPIYFDGHNGKLFQLLGMIHPRLRTIRLVKEFNNKCGMTFDVSAGRVIAAKKIKEMESDTELTAYLRLRTYMLDKRAKEVRPPNKFLRFLPQRKKPKIVDDSNMEPVADPVPPGVLTAELETLSPDSLLFSSGKFDVYKAKAKLIPNVLREIGRLREHTFRQVGEGTGKPLDLDEYDDYYIHLFIWEREEREVVGAYRIGKTDKIIQSHGIKGLYTSSLFTFKPALFEELGPALEMGRSFVRPKYQKSFSSLLLLWKGIGQYVLLNPDHHLLFGPVSISNDYSPVSQELIIRYFRQHDSISKLSRLVKPKTPPKLKTLKRHEIREFRNFLTTIEDVTIAIKDIETELEGIPVLLRQYLKLGGKVLSFNVDPDFNYCLDGLIMVDLLQTDKRVLSPYMSGRENVDNLHAYHEAKKSVKEEPTEEDAPAPRIQTTEGQEEAG